MLRTGVVSITFRHLPPERVIALAVEGGLALVEWGGDVHVPHGDLGQARAVARMTREAGLATAAYGSYYRVGAENAFSFEEVVETAAELGAPTIRVWAGPKGTDPAALEPAQRATIVRALLAVAGQAEKAGLTVSCEFHGGTLTGTRESAALLVRETEGSAVRAYWQPAVGRETACRLAGLEAMLPRLTVVHVFHWRGTERRPLEEGAAEWRLYLGRLVQAGGDYAVLLEFTRDSEPDNFLRDARVLNGLVAEAEGRAASRAGG